MKVLIVEDEIDIIKPIKKVLETNSFIVEYALSGDKGLEMLLNNSYAVAILDLNLPVVGGLEICKKIRQEKVLTPILMLTARSQIEDKLEGFNSGTDDYLSKPFDMRELVARVTALSKRDKQDKSNNLIFHQYSLNVLANKVIAKGREIELTSKETALLQYLILHQGQIISSEEILLQVWDSNTDFFTDTVKTHIKTIRSKIDPNKKIIKTIKGKGYILE